MCEWFPPSLKARHVDVSLLPTRLLFLKGVLMPKKNKSFRIGRVRGDLRGQVWYLTYYQSGQRFRPRIGPNLDEARQEASRLNAQLEGGTPVAAPIQSIKITQLQSNWLDHHETVNRSSLKTISRYRSASQHLLEFLKTPGVPATTAHFRVEHAEQFVRYLRDVLVSPNGHPHTAKRPLRDKGLRYILEVCRSMFHFAIKHRHLPPYSDNPFSLLQIERIADASSQQIQLFSPEEEVAFLLHCDDWQFPLFLTLMLTGMRPGELSHIIWPDDLDLNARLIFVRNRPTLGWQVKTRTDRYIPLHPILAEILALHLKERAAGTLFQRRRFCGSDSPELAGCSVQALEQELDQRIVTLQIEQTTVISRRARQSVAQTVWRDFGLVKPDRIRTEFIRVCNKGNLKDFTSPKMLRHMFATTLQEGSVDPLIRNELMGHSTSVGSRSNPLVMTAAYTHTRIETMRRQLESALNMREAIPIARRWRDVHRPGRC